MGRDGELPQLTHTLLRRTKNNPVLIGEAGACLCVGLGCLLFIFVGRGLSLIHISQGIVR
mgnify:CR=1 FL=1